MEPLADSIPSAATNANSTPLQRAMIRELLIGQDPKMYSRHCEVILGMRNDEPAWKSITAPVLILAGDQDKSAPLEGCQTIHDNLASEQKTLKVLKDVGHWHCLEDPLSVINEINAFAESIA